MKRAIIVPALVTAFVALSPVGVALADNPHSPANPTGPATGQPSQSEDGRAARPQQPRVRQSRSWFTPTLDLQGGTSSGNPHVVSQYDVAGFQCCQHREVSLRPHPLVSKALHPHPARPVAARSEKRAPSGRVGVKGLRPRVLPSRIW